MQGDNISTVGDNISTVEGIQYCGGIPSVLWGITAVHAGDSFSTVGIPSVLWRLFSTVGDNISTVGDNISTVGDNISTVGDSFSSVEDIQYIGG